MCELVLMIGAAVVMGMIASQDDRSPAAWGFITFGLCVVSAVIPLPFLRVLIACAIALGAMVVHKLATERG